ncbi:restriction endonuclease subunit S [Acinetobacter wuhouensis]|uniref:restriction endonuclease subunit S n=1 Tax=Acinetobacter wuhouensis TaxID=1879050 RepID=UPI0013EED1B1|nr:restriction endonuclease subunit S [Acinetobacter wuhouensis]
MSRLDISAWKEFRVSELFNITPTSYHRLINKDLLDDDGINPVVVNSSYNNGIGGYSNYDCTEKGNTITFSDTTTADSIFYQPNDFVGYSHVQKLTPILYQNKWVKNCLLFFMIVFRTKAKLMNFDYVNKFTRENALNLLVKLPAKDNEPDWEYMEDYVSNIFTNMNNNYNKLKVI